MSWSLKNQQKQIKSEKNSYPQNEFRYAIFLNAVVKINVYTRVWDLARDQSDLLFFSMGTNILNEVQFL